MDIKPDDPYFIAIASESQNAPRPVGNFCESFMAVVVFLVFLGGLIFLIWLLVFMK